MGFLSGVGNFLGNLFGGDSEEEKRRKQQAQQNAISSNRSANVVKPTQTINQVLSQPTTEIPDNGINLVLQKKTPTVNTGSQDTQELLKKAPTTATANQGAVQTTRNISTNTTPSKVPFTETAKGATEGLARVAIDTVKGIDDLRPQNAIPKMAGWAANKLTGNKYTDTIDKYSGRAFANGTSAQYEAPKKALVDWRGDSKEARDAATQAYVVGSLAATKIPMGPAEAGVNSVYKTGSEILSATKETPLIASAAKALSKIPGKIAGALRKPVAPGVGSVNPTQEVDAAKAAADQAAKQAAEAEMARLRQNPTENPGARSNEQSMNQALADQAARDAADTSVPSYLTKDTRTQVADTANTIQQPSAQDPLDIPTYQRNGITLPSERFDETKFNAGLNDTAGQIASDPALAGPITQAYQETGNKNALSLVMHTMAQSKNKAGVRDLLKRLIPGLEGNTLNRTVNAIIGSETPSEVGDALNQAGRELSSPQPFGALSQAPADVPTVTGVAPSELPSPASVETPVTVSPDVPPSVPDGTFENPYRNSAEAEAAYKKQQQEQAINDAIRGDKQVNPQPNSVQPQTAAPDGQIPEMPSTPNPDTVPTAPLYHDQLVKQMGEDSQSLKGKYGEREQLHLDELKARAEGVVANMTDEELMVAFSSASPDTMVTDAKSLAIARAALNRFSAMDSPAAVQQVENILNAMDKAVSKGAQIMRVAQEEFDAMPTAMKVRYIMKKIDAANADTKGYETLSSNPAKGAIVEATVDSHMKTGQAIAEQVAAVKGKINEVIDAISRGEQPGITKAELGGLQKQLKTLENNLQVNNGELVKYYNTLVPGRTAGQKALSDFPRTMMLSSLTGRVNDLITTGANIAHVSATNVVQGLLAKAVNLVKPGKVADGTRGFGKIFTGGANDLKKVPEQIVGKQHISDIPGALQKGATGGRTNMVPQKGVVGRTVQAATETATQASAGIRDQKLYQLAMQEAQKLGIDPKLRKMYAEARSATPSRHMLDQAEQLHKEVNNLNENFVSKTLNRVAAGMEGSSPIGGLIKNQVMPFTSWLGGNIWNSVTDKNVLANVFKLSKSAFRRDLQGVTENLAKLAVNGTITYGIGYGLTKSGVITNTNAEGYNDAGAYFHIGDRYIPVGLFGFAAPSLILGNAVYNGFNSPDQADKSIANKIGASAKSSLESMFNSMNVSGAIGTESNISRAYDAFNKPGGDITDAGITLSTGVVGQYIPALNSDINAGLDQTSLNPTHEEANTKVVDPNSPSGEARDVGKSAMAAIQNKIPIASQQLPRKAGVAAKDLIDRTTKGDRDTTTSVQNRATAKTAADVSKDFLARGVPDYTAKFTNGNTFENTVKARFEGKQYDQAIEGLQAKLDKQKMNKDVPPSSLKELQDQITLYKVHKDGNFDPKFVEDYKGTTLAEWRDMGDPDSDTYDAKMYQKLYEYDTALAKAGISKSTLDKAENAFFAKKSGGGSGGGGGGGGTKSNTIGDVPLAKKVSLGDLKPEKVSAAPIPTIQQIKPGELIKKRAITIKKA